MNHLQPARLIPFCITTLLLATTVYAESPLNFIDKQTLAVARIDLASYDRPAVEQWLTTLLRANTDADTADFVLAGLSGSSLLTFPESLKAAGAKEFFAILSLSDFPPNIGYLAIPIPAGVTPQSIAAAVYKNIGLEPDANNPLQAHSGLFQVSAVVIDNTLIIHADGRDNFQHFTFAPRPDLDKSLAAADNAAVVICFSPSDDTRKVIEQMLPQLPPPASVPSTVLTHGLHTATLALTYPPKAILNLTIQSDNAPAAADLHALITQFLTLARQNPEFRKALPTADQFIQSIIPKLDADHLTLSLDPASTDQLIALFATPIARARETANRVKSASNLKQLGMGLLLYANDHKGSYPNSLDQTAQYFKNPDGSNPFKEVLQDPRSPNRPYLYLKPAADTKTISPQTIVAYESFDPNHWPDGINALFGDGHVEFISSQPNFTQLLNKSKSPQ